MQVWGCRERHRDERRRCCTAYHSRISAAVHRLHKLCWGTIIEKEVCFDVREQCTVEQLLMNVMHGCRRPVPGLSFLRSLSSADKDTTCSLPDLFNGQHFRREPISTPRYQYDGGASSQSAANIVERLKAQQRRLRSQRKSLRKNAKSLGDDAGAQSTLAVAEMGSLPRVKPLNASGQTCHGTQLPRHRSVKSVQQVASDSESRGPRFYR